MVYAKYVPAEIAWASKKGMAMNVRFNEGFVTDARFGQTAAAAFARIEEAALDAREIRKAWSGYVADFQAGRPSSPQAGVALAGFMLGMWLDRKPLIAEAAA